MCKPLVISCVKLPLSRFDRFRAATGIHLLVLLFLNLCTSQVKPVCSLTDLAISRSLMFRGMSRTTILVTLYLLFGECGLMFVLLKECSGQGLRASSLSVAELQ